MQDIIEQKNLKLEITNSEVIEAQINQQNNSVKLKITNSEVIEAQINQQNNSVKLKITNSETQTNNSGENYLKLKIVPFLKRTPNYENQKWNPLYGYEDIEISEYGKIRSKRGRMRELKIDNDMTTQAEISLNKYKMDNGKWKRKIEKICYHVAKSFIPNPTGTPFVRYINETKYSNEVSPMINHYSNLKWYSGDEKYENMIWRVIPGYDENKISEYGHVVSTKLVLPKRIMPNETAAGILNIKLTSNGYEHLYKLVALTFVENPNNYQYIRHKDGDYKNIHYSNLEWVESLIENINDLIWKDIPDYPYYKISEYGHVMTCKKKIPKMMHTTKRSYRDNVFLTKGNVQKYFIVEELVAKIFLENPNNYKYIIHKDGDLSNYHYTNLEWSPTIEKINKKDKTEWKNIPLYPMYKISNKGEVKSFSYNVTKLLKQHEDENGYFNVHLYNSLGPKRFTVHRLVAICFLDNPLNKPMVDHIDRDRKNNNVENLRWATAKENAENRADDNDHRGKEIAKLNENDEILAIYKSGAEAGRQNNCSEDMICNCARGIANMYNGFKWMYLNDEEEIYELQEGEIFLDLNKEFEWGENLIYPNYKISNFGTLLNKNGYRKTLIPCSGYYNYCLSKEGINKPFRVHRIVALFFVEGRTEERNIVNHRDENKLNFHYTNLEWVTSKENMMHSANMRRFRKVVQELKQKFM